MCLAAALVVAVAGCQTLACALDVSVGTVMLKKKKKKKRGGGGKPLHITARRFD